MRGGLTDAMENGWGTGLFLNTIRPAKKSQAQFNTLVGRSVPGFSLYHVGSSGTHVNMVAMNAASDYQLNQCLFALGSYVGGDEMLQELSTSMYDPASCLSVPKYYENASERCFYQTVPFPYHVKGSIDDQVIYDFEAKCLRSLHKRFIIMRLQGNPCRALLLEYILGGNGASLTIRFLERLAVLCKQFSVVVVADEVLTAARVGPTMAMTTGMPKAFQDVVMYITIGKFTGCGLVLKKKPKRPTEVAEKTRGTSTSHDCGYAYAVWEKADKCLANGAIKKRRAEVLEVMDLTEKPHLHWGDGLLMYSQVKRPQMMQALKNRYLPMCEPGVKITKTKCVLSKWTPQLVSHTIMETADEWLDAQEEGYEKSIGQAFLSLAVDYIFEHGMDRLEPQTSNESGYFRIRPEDVVSFVGEAKSMELAKSLRVLKQQGAAAASTMKALSFAKEALFLACLVDSQRRLAEQPAVLVETCENKAMPKKEKTKNCAIPKKKGKKKSPGEEFGVKAVKAKHSLPPPLIKKKKKTLKRTEFTFVHCKLFGAFNGADGSFEFFS